MHLEIGIAVTILTLTFNFLSLCMPYWYYGSTSDGRTIHFGLLQVCNDTENNYCYDIGDGGIAFNTSRIMMSLAFLAIMITLLCEAIKQLKMPEKRAPVLVGGIALFIAAALMFVGPLLFACDEQIRHNGYDWAMYKMHLYVGFVFAIFGAISSIIAGVLLIYVFIKEGKHQQTFKKLQEDSTRLSHH